MFARIHSVTQLQDVARFMAFHAGKPLHVVSDVANRTVEYVVAGTVIATETKLTPAMMQEHWSKRYKSDYCFVNEAAFRTYSKNVAWTQMTEQQKARRFRETQEIVHG